MHEYFVGMYMHHLSEEGVGSLGTRVMNGSKSLCGAGNQAWVLCKKCSKTTEPSPATRGFCFEIVLLCDHRWPRTGYVSQSGLKNGCTLSGFWSVYGS